MGAPAGNPNDGTTLGTSEVIADEFIDPTYGGRQDRNQPVTGYKMPRSKIAVGVYGQDWGDASPDQPLAAESRNERWYLEMESLRNRVLTMTSFQRYAQETLSCVDSRGYDITTRGVR